MTKQRIFVAGHRGMVGSAIVRQLEQRGDVDVIVQVAPRYFRPAEVETLLGDPSKAHEQLGWKPEITLQEMVSEMVAKDLEAAKKHSLLKSHGYEVAIALES